MAAGGTTSVGRTDARKTTIGSRPVGKVPGFLETLSAKYIDGEWSPESSMGKAFSTIGAIKRDRSTCHLYLSPAFSLRFAKSCPRSRSD